QAEDGIRDFHVTGVQTCALPICRTGGIARDWSFGYIPLLTRFGQNISEQMGRQPSMTVDVSAHTNVLDQLVNTFGSGGRQNAVRSEERRVGKGGRGWVNTGACQG